MAPCEGLVIPGSMSPDEAITSLACDFIDQYPTAEAENGVPHLLMLDEKSGGFYLVSHLYSKTLSAKSDLDAVLDPDEGDEYKLNREIHEDTYAYEVMKRDAVAGRSFEDLVVEYDTSYRPGRPLKVFGGQHRITAIRQSIDNECRFHTASGCISV